MIEKRKEIERVKRVLRHASGYLKKDYMKYLKRLYREYEILKNESIAMEKENKNRVS